MTDFASTAVFCRDSELGYERSRTRFTPGNGLAFDETYRLAHLPLVAPDHPKVIGSREGAPYAMGRRPPVFSLVLPVPGMALDGSNAYQELNAELKASPFRRKIAWDLLERRRGKVHATICGSLSTEEPPVLYEGQRRELAALGPVSVELRGLFSGNVNVGRLYLRAYPESRNGQNVFRQIQRIMGGRETDLYVVGTYNLTDDLDAAEASALGSLIDRWWSRPILRFETDHLWLLGATDDLVLDSTVVEAVPLV
jgi:hypothetical protein